MRVDWIGCTALVALAGCAAGRARPSAPVARGPATFEEQVAQGDELFGVHCASCHGVDGQGTQRAPRVAEGALPLRPPPTRLVRRAEFRTVADVADFVVHNMPPGEAGSLRDDEYWAILAFDLHANGVELAAPLDGTVAPMLTIPR
jgi:cytochrome c